MKIAATSSASPSYTGCCLRVNKVFNMHKHSLASPGFGGAVSAAGLAGRVTGNLYTQLLITDKWVDTVPLTAPGARCHSGTARIRGDPGSAQPQTLGYRAAPILSWSLEVILQADYPNSLPKIVVRMLHHPIAHSFLRLQELGAPCSHPAGTSTLPRSATLSPEVFQASVLFLRQSCADLLLQVTEGW